MVNFFKNRFAMLLALTLPFLFVVHVFAAAPNFMWAAGNGGDSYEFGDAIALDSSGNSYVTGYFLSPVATFGNYDLSNRGSWDVFVTKYDSAGNVLWAKSAGGDSDDIANGIAVDGAGNCYVTGYFYGTANFDGIKLTNSSFGGDIFIAKYDSLGNIVWAKRAGGSADEAALAIAVTTNGNSYITGYFTSGTASFGSTILTNSGGLEIFVARYDSSGNCIWAKRAGSSADDSGNGIAVDAAGNCYVTGYFAGATSTFDATTLINVGSADVFVAKYDSVGNLIWARQAGGANYETANAIAADPSGNSFVTGTFQGQTVFGGISLTNTGNGTDIFVVKYDASGNVVWAKQAGGGEDDAAQAICLDAAGFPYLTGYFTSTRAAFGGITLTNVGVFSADVFVAKLDRSGNTLWAKQAGGIDDEHGVGIAADGDGNSYITGYFNNNDATLDGTTLINKGGSDIFTAKIEAPFALTLTQLPDNEVQLTWPILPFGSYLQSSVILPADSSWQNVTNVPVLSGDQNSITLNSLVGNRFFRAVKP